MISQRLNLKPAKFCRMDHIIQTLDANGNVVKDEHLPSINAAKRKSRELQMQSDGALGRGTVRTDTKPRKKPRLPKAHPSYIKKQTQKRTTHITRRMSRRDPMDEAIDLVLAADPILGPAVRRVRKNEETAAILKQPIPTAARAKKRKAAPRKSARSVK